MAIFTRFIFGSSGDLGRRTTPPSFLIPVALKASVASGSGTSAAYFPNDYRR